MSFSSVPIIVICCYLIGEAYKQIFKKKTEAYRFIPIILPFVGGILGIVMFFTNPEMIFDADNAWVALGVGIVSGASSTGANQIFKQMRGQNVQDSNGGGEK